MENNTNVDDQEKKSGKKKWLILLLLLLLLFLIGGGIAAAMFIPRPSADASVVVVFDPTKTDSEEHVEHLNSAQRFAFDLSDGAEERTTKVNAGLANVDEYIVFSYEIVNNGPNTVKWQLNFENIKNTGFKIQYRLGHLNDIVDLNVEEGWFIESEDLKPNSTNNLWVFFKLADDFSTAQISGSVVLTISLA